MTRNLYLGTALDNVVAASNPQELVQAVSQDWAHVVATDFPTRAKALAAFDPYQGLSQQYWLKRARRLGAVTDDVVDEIEEERREKVAEEEERRAEKQRRNDAARKPQAKPLGGNPFQFD